MAQNFWGAIGAWTACFGITAVLSLLTPPKPAAELAGLVYGRTPHDANQEAQWFRRPGPLAAAVLAGAMALNIIFW